MFGRRLIRNSAGASEDLNSSPRITSEGRTTFQRFSEKVLPYVLATSIIGATMAQPRQVAAQEGRTGQADVRALETARTELATQLSAIRQTLSQMQSSGITPVQVGATDANVRRLTELCATNATALGIPITGSTPEARFQSLNDWLDAVWHGRAGLSGRNRDSPLDSAALDELEFRLNVASGRPAAQGGADALLAALRQQQPAAPVASGGTAQGTAHPQQAAASLREQNAQVLTDLQTIEEYGRSAAVRSQAHTLITDLNREFDRTAPRQTTINSKLTQARRLITAELQRSEQRAMAASASAYQTRTGQPHPLSTEVTQLYSAVQGMSGPVAEQIRRRIPDVWLLGETEMRTMFNSLKAAQQALAAGNETEANARLQDATTLFNHEQALYAQLLERYIVPTARGTVAEAHSSTLPTRSDLQHAEARFHQHSGTYYNLPIYDNPVQGQRRRLIRRVQNGREDIERSFQGRLDAATALQARAGKIPYNVVSDLYSAVTTDASAFHVLSGLWEDARSQGIDTSAEPDKIYQNFSAAAAVFVDPEYDPFSNYSRDQQLRIVRDFLGLSSNAQVSDTQLRSAASQISSQLRRNTPLRYDWYVQFPTFETVMGMRQPSAEQTLQQLASVRSMRFSLQLEYLPYTLGRPPTIPGMTDDQVLNLTSPQLAQHRFELARDYLQRTVAALTASGMRATDPVLVSANAWLTRYRTAPTAADQVVPTADALYNMSMSLISIREAEIWAANSSFRSSSLPSGAVTRANALITEARRAFQWNFSNPAIDPAFHYNIPGSLADTAIRTLVPRSFLDLEASGMYFARGGYLNPTLPMYGVHTAGAEPTRDEHVAGVKAGEQRFLSYVINMRDSANFSPSVAETTLAQNSMDLSMRALSFSIGRNAVLSNASPPIAQQGQGQDPNFPTYNGVLRRWRPTINPLDIHVLPPGNQLNRNLEGIQHEDTSQYIFGQLYVELDRLAMMHNDSGTPEALRSMNVAPDSFPIRTGTPYEAQDQRLKARFQAIARQYGLPTDQPILVSLRDKMNQAAAAYATNQPAAELQQANRLVLAVLDLRIAELETRLSGKVPADDGHVYDVTDVERRATAPSVYYITRARQMLADAQRLRTAFNSSLGTDLESGQVTMRQAIAIAEMGISSMDHTMPHPVRPAVPDYVVNARIDPQRLGGNPTRIQFRALDLTIQAPGQRTPVPLDQYERQHGTQNLTYYWFEFQRTGRRDSSGDEIQYLLNPRYLEQGQPRYVGQVMHGRIKMPDGSFQAGDFIARVHEAHGAGTGPYFDPVTELDGSVRLENVLSRVNWVTRDGVQVPEPARDSLFTQRMEAEHFARERQSPVDTVLEYGPTTPVLIISPSASDQSR
jgi:hypothetical protein